MLRRCFECAEIRCGCISSCQEALIAGDGKSQKVYDVVWGYIEASEDARALSEATGELRAAAAAPAGAKPTQHVDDVRRRPVPGGVVHHHTHKKPLR